MDIEDKNWLRLLAERVLDTKTKLLSLTGNKTGEEVRTTTWQTNMDNQRKKLLADVLKKAAE